MKKYGVKRAARLWCALNCDIIPQELFGVLNSSSTLEERWEIMKKLASMTTKKEAYKAWNERLQITSADLPSGLFQKTIKNKP